ncbi:hypothetical protein CONCODRAFT_6498 [Conidiobolus coronatus NRRL 28638]|uniref:C2 domain-containing protein n=1 Tax=Conidiobolus coronatus (strain ATCC 28846 / CBS 209.66 / NRRL 28638) TaxID=796925 RepID=A0A137P783_CONC2|nr:hypothetical protein CONCODRAFT_6498 [Conidiobolus coronatus NRRL 28638]|eukprot:KXN70873.1 hypothetical protein CONCODRAFT_6498 [Conidiobolus coronatus NRRL 28638]
MTKLNVDVVEARDFTGDSELSGINNAYLQLCILNPSISQRQTTKPQSGLGKSISFGESFQFDVNETDDLEVKLCDNEFLWGEKSTGVRIPLRDVFETNGSMCAWFPLSGAIGEKSSGEILLNIQTQ